MSDCQELVVGSSREGKSDEYVKLKGLLGQ